MTDQTDRKELIDLIGAERTKRAREKAAHDLTRTERDSAREALVEIVFVLDQREAAAMAGPKQNALCIQAAYDAAQKALAGTNEGAAAERGADRPHCRECGSPVPTPPLVDRGGAIRCRRCANVHTLKCALAHRTKARDSAREALREIRDLLDRRIAKSLIPQSTQAAINIARAELDAAVAARCRFCDGKGWTVAVPCSLCNPEETDDGSPVCSKCGGDGFVPVACEHCDGSGRDPDAATIENPLDRFRRQRDEARAIAFDQARRRAESDGEAAVFVESAIGRYHATEEPPVFDWPGD